MFNKNVFVFHYTDDLPNLHTKIKKLYLEWFFGKIAKNVPFIIKDTLFVPTLETGIIWLATL